MAKQRKRPIHTPTTEPRGPSSRYAVIRDPGLDVGGEDDARVPTSAKRSAQLLLRASFLGARSDEDGAIAWRSFQALVNPTISLSRTTPHGQRARRPKAPCNRMVLTGFLLHIRACQPTLNRETLRRAAAAFDCAANLAFEIELSAQRLLVDPEGRFQNLSNVLREYGDRLRLLVRPSTGTARAQLEFNVVLATILRHVRRNTGGWYDQEIARLIGEPDRDLKDWRKQHRDLLQSPTPLEHRVASLLERRREQAHQIRQNRRLRRYGAAGRRNYLTSALQAARASHPALFGRGGRGRAK